MIRNQTIYIDGKLHRKLRMAAELLGYEGPDAVDALAHIWLTERLDAMPELEELMNAQTRALSELRQQWLNKHRPTT